MSDPNDPKERKEKVIHTRVPESLDDEIRKRASSLGVSVSNLVRNALGHAFGLVEDVITDSANVARSARGEEEGEEEGEGEGSGKATPASPGRVLGYQRLILAMNALCAECNAILPKGQDAAVAVTERPGPRIIVCLDCVGGDEGATT